MNRALLRRRFERAGKQPFLLTAWGGRGAGSGALHRLQLATSNTTLSVDYREHRSRVAVEQIHGSALIVKGRVNPRERDYRQTGNERRNS